MKVGILGAGALGLMFASKLQKRKDAQYYLIARTEQQREKIREKGIIFEEDELKEKIDIEVLTENQKKENIDWIFLMVKQTHLQHLEKSLSQWVSKDTKIIAFQNGIGHYEQLKRMTLNPIYLAVTTEGAYKKNNNHVIHTGVGETYVGSTEGNEIPEQIINFLNEAGIKTVYSENILEKVWRKLIINAAINPLSAIYEVKNGQLIENEVIKSIMRKIVGEVIAVANAEGISFVEDMEKVVEQVCQKTSENYSSMLQDIKIKKKTEIEAIAFEIVYLGEKRQIKPVTLELLAQLVRGKESLW